MGVSPALQFRNLAIRRISPTLQPMRKLHDTLYREESNYVAQCLDYDVPSFGSPKGMNEYPSL